MVLRGSKINDKNQLSLINGGIAGVISRSFVAPLDKIKILMQIRQSNLSFSGQLLYDIRNKGFKNLWKGNLINSARIFPYSGLQFFTYDFCKKNYKIEDISNYHRLLFGSFAGIVATTVTHPMDVIRHRIMCYDNINNIRQANIDIYNEKGLRTFYKGYGSTIMSLTPFIAINFSTFDILKYNLLSGGAANNYSNINILGIGALSGLISQTICYPLDTIRRRMQIRENNNVVNVFTHMIRNEGFLAFYKGIIPNIIKIVPNNAIRFTVYEFINNNINPHLKD